jgi:hypothetical protein
MRLLNLILAAALVLAAGYVYKSKFAAAVEAERVAKLRIEITRERDRIASLRAESAKLEAPARIQALAERHLSLKPLDLNQIDTIDAIPFPPTEVTPRPSDAPAIAKANSAPPEVATGSIPAPTPPSRPAPPPVASRPVPPRVTNRSVSPRVTSRHTAPAAPPRYAAPAAPPDPVIAPLRPPADVWTSSVPETADPR